jgi:hypothetical protein
MLGFVPQTPRAEDGGNLRNAVAPQPTESRFPQASGFTNRVPHLEQKLKFSGFR